MNGQVNNRYVWSWNVECYIGQFVVQFWQYFIYCFSSVGRGWDDVLSCVVVVVLVFVRWVINGFLSSGGSVDGGYQVFNDIEVVVDNFSQWCQVVSGVGSVGNDVLVSVSVEVSVVNEYWSVVFGWVSQNDFFCVSGDVFMSGFVGQEDIGCFSNNVNINFVLFQVSWVMFSGNMDFFIVNDQMIVFYFNGIVEMIVSGVIFQYVSYVFCV